MKGGTSQNLSSFYFHNSWIYVEIMTQNVNFPIWPVQYLCLPEYSKNVQGHTYCKQSCHPLGHNIGQHFVHSIPFTAMGSQIFI